MAAKSVLGLAGKADDQVGGDGGVRDCGPHAVDDAEVPLGPVGPAHGPQDAVGAGLQRHVQRGAHVRGGRHRLDDVVGELGRVRRGEPDALQAVDAAAGAQQLRERTAIAGQVRVGERHAVGVDVLPEQGHLEHALVHERLHLGEHVAGPAVDLLAAQRRHDAERAGVVAAHRDGNPSGIGRFARRRQRGGELLQRLDDLDLGDPVVPGAIQQRGQRPDVVGTEDDVDPRGLRSTASRSFCARHPPTAICMSGLACLRGTRWLRLPYSLLSAFSRTAQVLNTTTSASTPSAARWYPAASSRPTSRSESCTFIWQP